MVGRVTEYQLVMQSCFKCHKTTFLSRNTHEMCFPKKYRCPFIRDIKTATLEDQRGRGKCIKRLGRKEAPFQIVFGKSNPDIGSCVGIPIELMSLTY